MEMLPNDSPAPHPTDQDLSVGTPALHPTDQDLSVGTPALHPTDQDLSVGTPAPPSPEVSVTANTATEVNPAPAPPRREGGIGLWLRDLLVSAAASVLIITFLYQPVRVEGTSMLPRLEDRDRLFINKFVYHFAAIERGDVVVFHYPRDPEKSYIKRVIALPGDRLRIDHGVVWLNGQQQIELYVPEEYRDTRSVAELVVPEDCFYMMGDHRSISSDSREFGPVERSLIYGKAVFVYWPAQDAGVVH
ncbi:MAG: signal peptidase I [Terracidiphilus sp.]